MEPEIYFSLTPVWVGIFTICIYLLLRHVVVDRSNGLPPGPKFRFPLVGNIYAVEADMRKFLRRYRNKYGDIYSLYLGNKLVIVIAGYDKIKDAFVKKADIFSYRPIGKDLFRELTGGLGISYTDGDFWREQRKFGVTTFKQLGMLSSVLEDKAVNTVKELLNVFQSNATSAFNPEDAIYMSVNSVITSLILGDHIDREDKRFKNMLKKIKALFETQYLSSIGLFIPALDKLPGDLFKIKKTKSDYAEIDKFLRGFVNDHLQFYDENNIKDFTSAFIQEMRKQETVQESTTFTVDQLVAVLREFYLAGTETTSSITLWALVYLVNYPDLQEQMFADVLREVGEDRLPCLEDRSKVPMIDAFMFECLRHVTLLFTSLSHATSKDIYLHGYLIPKEATILPDLDSVFKDATTWKDPEAFRPDRFIAENGVLLQPQEFVPFFVGKRRCIGEPIARTEMFLFLSAIVQNFKVTAPPCEDLSLDKMSKFGFTHAPKAFRIVATPRGKLPF